MKNRKTVFMTNEEAANHFAKLDPDGKAKILYINEDCSKRVELIALSNATTDHLYPGETDDLDSSQPCLEGWR